MHDVGDDDAADTIPGLVVYRFYGPLIFANVRFFIERLEHYFSTYKLVPGEGQRIRVAGTFGYEHAAAVVQAAMEDYRAHFGSGDA